ncbi:MAG: Asp-tRNA(Asn)/Glu-tRNA(Gln) amidotransferase subunit GatA [Ruminococcus sp.]|nr:Asp-tRNA(Asn)/Glu-tRNA(Gln) amidotransferase subunit GatA [Ruminococcus sp.]
MELYNLSGYELSKKLESKEISSKELTEAVFERIESVEGKVDAYVTLDKENALKKAAEVDEKRASGEKLSRLAGLPVGIKDNISTRNLRTTCSSKMLENYIPPFNATVMDKLNREDIVITGKLNMDEFAMGSSTETSYFKKTKNPFDETRIPGGSSGGSAAAVSAGEAIMALGSDTGGSIRQPASYCGVVGLKPTYGAVSRFGLVAFASSLDQIGPIGRTVKDTAMLYSAICGFDKMDATSKNMSHPDYLANLKSDVKGLRIGVPKEYFSRGIDENAKSAVLSAVKVLEQNGAVVKEVSLPSTEYALNAYYIISSAEASSNLARYDGVKYGYRAKNYDDLTDMYEKTRSEGFGDEVKRRIMLGTFVLSSGYYDAYYKKARLLQRRISKEFCDVFKEVDLLAAPTVPSTAFKIGENIDNPLKMYATDVCTVTINIAGLPAISVPCGYDEAGLPIGLQLISDKFNEQTLLNTAECYENIMGGFRRPVL